MGYLQRIYGSSSLLGQVWTQPLLWEWPAREGQVVVWYQHMELLGRRLPPQRRPKRGRDDRLEEMSTHDPGRFMIPE